MHQQAHKVISECIQTEEYSDTDIINTSLHGAVHGYGMPGIVTFGAGGVEELVIFLVIGLLKEDIGADSCIPQSGIVFYRCSCNIHVYPADCPVPVFDAIDGIDGFKNVLNRVEKRMFSGFQCEAFVPHVL